MNQSISAAEARKMPRSTRPVRPLGKRLARRRARASSPTSRRRAPSARCRGASAAARGRRRDAGSCCRRSRRSASSGPRRAGRRARCARTTGRRSGGGAAGSRRRGRRAGTRAARRRDCRTPPSTACARASSASRPAACGSISGYSASGRPPSRAGSSAGVTGLPFALRASGLIRPRGGPSGSCERRAEALVDVDPVAVGEAVGLVRERDHRDELVELRLASCPWRARPPCASGCSTRSCWSRTPRRRPAP